MVDLRKVAAPVMRDAPIFLPRGMLMYLSSLMGGFHHQTTAWLFRKPTANTPDWVFSGLLRSNIWHCRQWGWGRSSVCTKNRTGSKTGPCGTVALTGAVVWRQALPSPGWFPCLGSCAVILPWDWESLWWNETWQTLELTTRCPKMEYAEVGCCRKFP